MKYDSKQELRGASACNNKHVGARIPASAENLAEVHAIFFPTAPAICSIF